VEFRILGPLEVIGDEHPIAVPGGRPRALLAMLLLSANRTVARDRLIDGLWGEAVPGSGAKMIQIYVSRLRQVLPPSLLQTRAPGYVLELDPEQLDLNRFRELAGQGRAALAAGNPDEASARLGEALALWRGPALREFAEPFAAAEAAHLEELHLATLETRMDAELARGRAAERVGELESLVSAEPLRERLRGQLMLALYRSGRQADALAAYQETRRTLGEELGLNPSPELQQLEQAILRQDEALAPPKRSEAAVPSEHGTATSAGFVGRDRELARLRAALPATASAGGGAVLLVGAPGIGKTRLAQEFADRAQDAGVSVAWGRCYGREAAPPYWPWREAIRALTESWTAEQLADAAGPDASALARIVPEAGELLRAASGERVDADPEQARFRLFDSITSFLLRAAARQPFVILFDDLHAADADSLSLLAFAARQLPHGRLLVVATLRDGEPPLDDPLAEALGALQRAGGTARLTLGGLPRSALTALIEAQFGTRPSAELVAELEAGTAGNPLFVSEVMRLALDEQTGDFAGDELRERFRAALPGGVRSAIVARVSALSARCRDVLVAASVLGRDPTVARLNALTGLDSAEATLDAMDEAIHAGLLTTHPARPGRYEFEHALVRDALLAQLPPARRARLHLRAAESLERLYGSAADDNAAELAHHLEAAGALAAPSRTAHFASVAAAAALRSQAYKEAQRLFRLALAAKAEVPMDDQIAGLLVGLARAELATLGLHQKREFRDAVDLMRRAFDHYAAAGDIARAVEVAALPVPPIYRTTSADEYRDLTARALDLVPPDSLEAGRLLGSTGWFAGAHRADLSAATTAFEKAVEIARRYSDDALEMQTLLHAAYVDFHYLRWSDCFAHATRALELAQRARDPRAEVFARIWAARSALVLGDAESARGNVSASVRLAEQLREPYWLNGAYLDATWLECLEGRWDAARSAAERSLAAEPFDTRALACGSLIEYQCGERERGDELLARLIDAHAATADAPEALAHNVVAVFMPLLNRIAEIGDEYVDVAHVAAARARAAGVIHPLSDVLVEAGLGLIAATGLDARAAAAHRAAVAGQAGTILLVAATSADRLLGLLAAASGDEEAATRHFERALQFCRDAGYRAEWAWAAHDFIAFHARHNGQSEATPLLDEAREVAGELGMVALLEHLERQHSMG